MKFIEIQWKPADRQLRQFGLIALFALPFFAWWFTTETRPISTLLGGRLPAWDAGNTRAIAILAAIGAILALGGLIRPQTIRWVFLGACLVTMPIGLVVSELAVLLIYFGVFFPMAMIFRLIGRDALDRRFEPQRATYWQPKAQFNDVRRYYRQY